MHRAAAILCMLALAVCGGFVSAVAGTPALSVHASARSSPSSVSDSSTASEALAMRSREALTAAVRALDIQARLPTETARPNAPEPPSLPDVDFNTNLDITTVARIVLWVAVLLMLVILLATLKDNLWSSSRSRSIEHWEEARETAPVAVAARMDEARVEADVLAAQGRYADAMHVLLLQSVGEVRRRLDLSIAVSLTSREIARHVDLPVEGEEAFSDIVSRVEISYFGQHIPDEQDYAACRASFAALTRALGRERAAPGFESTAEPPTGVPA